ncbi:MAG: hypothetical protein HKL99_10695 [Burkholderiales bacterium]|nr:hypothetical protein [Burkholderiales bacterium]
MSWRDGGRFAKLFGIDATAALGMVPFLVHWSWATLRFSIGVTMVFIVGQFLGMRPVELFRKFRFWAGGSIRPAPARIGAVRDRMNAHLLGWWVHPRD